MSNPTTLSLTLEEYEQAAAEYQDTLPLEHYMEGISQGTQRRIALDSLTELKDRRGDIEFFNELLVQYIHEGELKRVCPDNMVIRGQGRPKTDGSYNIEHEPIPPFLVLEYVSRNSRGKDYEEGFTKYEQELKVPYCVMFDPERQDLRVCRHKGEAYEHIEPDGLGRYAIPELELHVGVVDECLRYWYQGDLIELRPDLRKRLEEEIAEQEQAIEQQQQVLEQRQREIEQRDQTIEQRDQTIEQRDQTIEQRDQTIEQLQDQTLQFLQRLRQRVEKKATKAGRDDIVQRLAATHDPEQLDKWLDELD